MFRSLEAIQRTVGSRFGGRRVLVVGDLMLDIYLWGEVSRISWVTVLLCCGPLS